MTKTTLPISTALVTFLALTGTTHAEINNGPNLEGTRVHTQSEAHVPAGLPINEFHGIGGSCPPWSCGVNGPDLDGTRIAIGVDQEVGFIPGTGDTCLPTNGCPTNGPDLDGTRIPTQSKTPVQPGLPINEFHGIGDGSCQPWQCGVNGPDLDGTRIGAGTDQETGIIPGGTETCLPSSGCPTNGPDLDGTRVHTQSKAHVPAGLPINEFHGIGGSCAPWQCGVNGPDLDGTRIGDGADQEVGFIPGTGQSCMPGTGCPTNGPDLDGSRFPIKIDMDLDIVAAGNAAAEVSFAPTGCPAWGCGANGPDLDGTRIGFNGLASLTGITACPEEGCGVNGPTIHGLRAGLPETGIINDEDRAILQERARTVAQ